MNNRLSQPFVTALLTFAISMMCSCSHINDDERLIYVKPAAVQRAVLIEDFTGQRCVNCPTATDVIHDLELQYGTDAVIAVGIHSGPFARSAKGTRYALGTDEGDEYYAHWKLDRQPIGMVNRRRVADYTEWSTMVYNEIQTDAPLSIELALNFDDTQRRLNILTHLMALDGTITAKLQVWIVEDGIEAFQSMPDNSTDRAYIHNHVFRAAVNGTWGQDVNIPEGNTATLSSSIKLNEEWNAGNVAVVAFVYDENGVLQVTRKYVTQLP